MPTYAWLARFGADFAALSPTQQQAFLAAVVEFVEDLRAGRGFRSALPIKGVRGAPGIFEMTWAPDERATFQYGDPVVADKPHIIWRRVGTNSVLRQP